MDAMTDFQSGSRKWIW